MPANRIQRKKNTLKKKRKKWVNKLRIEAVENDPSADVMLAIDHTIYCMCAQKWRTFAALRCIVFTLLHQKREIVHIYTHRTTEQAYCKSSKYIKSKQQVRERESQKIIESFVFAFYTLS